MSSSLVDDPCGSVLFKESILYGGVHKQHPCKAFPYVPFHQALERFLLCSGMPEVLQHWQSDADENLARLLQLGARHGRKWWHQMSSLVVSFKLGTGKPSWLGWQEHITLRWVCTRMCTMVNFNCLQLCHLAWVWLSILTVSCWSCVLILYSCCL